MVWPIQVMLLYSNHLNLFRISATRGHHPSLTWSNKTQQPLLSPIKMLLQKIKINKRVVPFQTRYLIKRAFKRNQRRLLPKLYQISAFVSAKELWSKNQNWKLLEQPPKWSKRTMIIREVELVRFQRRMGEVWIRIFVKRNPLSRASKVMARLYDPQKLRNWRYSLEIGIQIVPSAIKRQISRTFSLKLLTMRT